MGKDENDEFDPEPMSAEQVERLLAPVLERVHADILAGQMSLMFLWDRSWLSRKFRKMGLYRLPFMSAKKMIRRETKPLVDVPHCFEDQHCPLRDHPLPEYPETCTCKVKSETSRFWDMWCPAHGLTSTWEHADAAARKN